MNYVTLTQLVFLKSLYDQNFKIFVIYLARRQNATTTAKDSPANQRSTRGTRHKTRRPYTPDKKTSLTPRVSSVAKKNKESTPEVKSAVVIRKSVRKTGASKKQSRKNRSGNEVEESTNVHTSPIVKSELSFSQAQLNASSVSLRGKSNKRTSKSSQSKQVDKSLRKVYFLLRRSVI